MKKTFKPIMLIIIIMAVCLFGRLLLVHEKPISVFGFSSFVVASSSMEPQYPVNCTVIVKKVPFHKLREGDTIVFEAHALNGRPAMHRIAKVTDGGVYTKGDNNKHEDNQLVTNETYIGKAVGKISATVFIFNAASTPLGFIAFIIVPVLLIIWICCFVIFLRRGKGKNEIKK